MNFLVLRDRLLTALQCVVGVVERRQTMPILSNVLLSCMGDVLSVVSTDLDSEWQTELLLQEALPEPVALTLNARKLLDICRALPEGSILQFTYFPSESRVRVHVGRSRFSLATLPAAEFPRFERDSQAAFTFSLPQKLFSLLLQRTHMAMALQDTRHYLNGMLLEIREDWVSVVATDGHRLSLTECASVVSGVSALQRLIVPRKSVLELIRFVRQEDTLLTLFFTEHQMTVQSTHFSFASRLIEGRFPDYRRLLNRDTVSRIVVDRDLLREALLRAAVLSVDKFRAVSFRFLPEEGLRILSNNADHEEVEELLTVTYEEGESWEAAFNILYLFDILAVTTGMLRLTFVLSDSRLLIEEVNKQEGGVEGLFLVMPLQL